MNSKTKRRAQFILASMLIDARNAISRLSETKPKIFRRNLEKIVFAYDSSRSVLNKLSDATDFILRDSQIKWSRIEEVGLCGSVLEWKSDLVYGALRKKKPEGDQLKLLSGHRDTLTYPETKPIWARLFKYLKSLLGSLIEAVLDGTKLKYILDFTKEYIECLDASVKFVQAGEEAGG